jgi:hypothetical protein
LQNQEVNQIRDKLEIAEESNADQISEFAKKVHIQFTFFNASASSVISKNLCRFEGWHLSVSILPSNLLKTVAPCMRDCAQDCGFYQKELH